MDVHIIAGSKSDLDFLKDIASVLTELEVSFDVSILSAHRDPEKLKDLILRSDSKLYIAVAGLNAALPGFIASHTLKPVIGVPLSGKVSLDSLLSMVQMPKGVPVAVVGVDNAKNAALLAARILALTDVRLQKKLEEYMQIEKSKIDEQNVEALKKFKVD